MISMYIWRALSWFYFWVSASYPNIRVGILLNKTIRNYHGVARLEDRNGKIFNCRFLVDKPRFLFVPSEYLVADIFNQFSKMNFKCHHLRIVHECGFEKTYIRNDVRSLLVDYNLPALKEKLIAITI